MSFTLTSTEISVSNDGVLHAQCRDIKGNLCTSTLDLNTELGNDDGAFNIFSSNFVKSASGIDYREGTMSVDLKKHNGTWVRSSICLDMYVCNIDGHLEFRKPSQTEYILLSCGALLLQGSTLFALCLGHDGKYHASQIDLNEHYGNKNGELVSDRNHFYNTARTAILKVSQTSALLCAETRNYDSIYRYSEIDICPNVLNRRGVLIFERHDDWFDRDGAVTKFLEKLPFVGFVVAGIHALAGNEQWAARAIAVCTNGSIVCVGIFFGFIVGGPAGGMIGAALVTPLGIAAETVLKDTIIHDDGLKAQFEEATIGRVIRETLRNTLAAGAAGYLAQFLGTVSKECVMQAAGELTRVMGTSITVGTAMTEMGSYALFKRVIDALNDEALDAQLVQEWAETETEVKGSH